MDSYQPIRELIAAVRARWRLLGVLRATVRGAAAASAMLGAGLVAAQWANRSPILLMTIVAGSIVLAAGALAWAAAPLRHVPSDRRVARFIEEGVPALDDRLITAVDYVESGARTSAVLAGPMLADAAIQARQVDLDAILPSTTLQRAGWRAAGATLVLMLVAFFGAGPARRSLDAASLVLFPSRARLSVQPGDARVTAGSPLTIEARLVGSRAPVDAQLELDGGDRPRLVAMAGGDPGTFRLPLGAVSAPFRYRVIAGKVTSPIYAVTVARPPRVTRVDLEYTYPAALGLKPRLEQDSGDIYAPSGTNVRVRIHTDLPAATGRLTFTAANALPLESDEPTMMSATVSVASDSTYRVVLADRDGLSSEGDTDYFIRVLEDRPPEVHVTKPATDRGVTRLEEVDIEARAEDDHGVERLELVYAVRGRGEQTVALRVPDHATSVTARHTLFLEDLDIQPGDFVSYYVRAWDRTGGTRPREARSDIFFLDVKPYEQEFALAQSQSMSGSGYSGALDELVNKQRQVVVATWKLNRRAENAKGAQSERDIRAVAGTESDLRSLVEQTASTFRESTMRDPRRREPGGSTPRRPEEDAMAAAAGAMGRAVTSLEALKTGEALPSEMEALNQLLKAQADIKRRQLSMSQDAAGAAGNANRNYDISTLFDRELQRQQQTSYETPKTTARPQNQAADSLDRIKDLARRQDELLRRQQDLSRSPLSPVERKRELEKLTREQSELRQEAEELARQMAQPQTKRPDQPQESRNSGRKDGQPDGQTSGSGSNQSGQQMRDVSEQMRQAANDLRRGAPQDAGTSGGRALETLRDLERRLQSPPDDRRRALGDLRLEAGQLADGQRQVAGELGTVPPGDAGKDGLRRLAGEQARLAERMRRLEDNLKQQSGTTLGARPGDERQGTALRDAARELGGLSDRMERAAEQLRATSPGSRPPGASAAQDIARQLDRLADRLGAAAGDTADDARRLSEQLARTQEVRDRLQQVGQALENADRENGRAAGASAKKTAGESGRTGEGRRGAGGTDLTKLREESLRQLQEAKNLLEELRRQDPSASRNGAGFTFEGQGMVMSAPGTESFKQDFARWDVLKQQLLAALEQAGSTLAKKAQAAAVKDRLAAGIDDTAPSDYRKQVDAYFRALAAGKR